MRDEIYVVIHLFFINSIVLQTFCIPYCQIFLMLCDLHLLARAQCLYFKHRTHTYLIRMFLCRVSLLMSCVFYFSANPLHWLFLFKVILLISCVLHLPATAQHQAPSQVQHWCPARPPVTALRRSPPRMTAVASFPGREALSAPSLRPPLNNKLLTDWWVLGTCINLLVFSLKRSHLFIPLNTQNNLYALNYVRLV